MKKVSVQFNLEVSNDATHKEVGTYIKDVVQSMNGRGEHDIAVGKLTALQINSIDGRK